MAVALVTGAGVRVGRAIALTLARAGYDVALHAHRSIEAAKAVADEVRAKGRGAWVFSADLIEAEAVDRLADDVMDALLALDLLVHNAALFERVPFEAMTREQYRRMHALNLEAPFFLTQRLLPLLRRAEAPSVVHITDILGERAVPGFAHYGITKAGLLLLTRTLAAELAPKIRVNAVSPGTVAFPEDYDEKAKASILRRIPLGREGEPEDVARAVLFFAQSPYVTGQVLCVDGGRSAVL